MFKHPHRDQKVILRTGKVSSLHACAETLMHLNRLLHFDSLALFEIVQRCRVAGHRNVMVHNDRLYPLVNEDGSVPGKIRDIVLACIQDEDGEENMELTPVDPIMGWSALI